MFGACILTFPLSLAIQAETFSEYLLQGLNIQICDNKSLEYICKKLIGFSLACKWTSMDIQFLMFNLK